MRVYHYSNRSLNKLDTCHPILRAICHELIKYIDVTVLCGYRDQAEQDQAFAAGNSRVKWPNGAHNKLPSLAVDLIPYPIDWDDHARIIYMAGMFMGIARTLGYKVRWGGDWNNNGVIKDEKLQDLVHFELIKEFVP